MGYEKIIGDAILGKTSTETAALKAGHLYAVQRAITCPSCGNILDVRRSVYIEVKDGSKHYIVCATCFDEKKEGLAPVRDHLLIHDGRVKE